MKVAFVIAILISSVFCVSCSKSDTSTVAPTPSIGIPDPSLLCNGSPCVN